MMLKDLMQLRIFCEYAPGTRAPVVKVACDNEWFVSWNVLPDVICDHEQLLATPACEQTEMYADGMQWFVPVRNVNHTVQHAAILCSVCRNIGIGGFDDGKFREQGIAVVAGRIHRVLAIGVIRPDRIGQKLHLACIGPCRKALAMLGVLIAHFLQENHIGMQFAQNLALMVQ